MVVLGIDPGLAATGWAILEKGEPSKLIAYGCWRTKNGGNISWRLLALSRKMRKVIQQYRPKILAVEEIFFAKNTKSAIKVAQALGAIKLTAENADLSVEEYTPLQIKTAMTGYGRAQKDQVLFMVQQILGVKKAIKPDHAADAAAAALTYLQTKLRNIEI